VGTFSSPRDEPTFEAFALLGAVGAATGRIRLGPLVARAGLRNPALLAKHVATLDTATGGRVELGLGAGATRDEALAFGYPFPTLEKRFEQLRDTLAIVRPLLAAGRVAYRGSWARAEGAIVNPRGSQEPAIPIIVGGNSAAAIRLAVEFADELNLDGPSPAAASAAIAAARRTCAELDRDPATLAVSVHILPPDIEAAGARRARLLAAYANSGVSRVMALVPGSSENDGVLDSFAADARAAGAVLG